MTEWKIQGSRVYGNGLSINCTNIVTAEQLYNTLNCYETELKILKHKIDIQDSMKLLQKHITTIENELHTINKILK